jgi:hypothetical protein
MTLPRRLARSLSTAAQTAAAATKPKPTSVAGTVPFHDTYILLHSHEPIAELPPRPSSDLQRTIQLSTPGTLVNFGWWAERPDVAPDAEKLTTFAANGDVRVTTARSAADVSASSDVSASQGDQPGEDMHLLVCTHGSRDCRCGERGGEVVRALRDAHAARLASATDGRVAEKWRKVKIGEVAHVGGHAHAANVLIYPRGDWCAAFLLPLLRSPP